LVDDRKLRLTGYLGGVSSSLTRPLRGYMGTEESTHGGENDTYNRNYRNRDRRGIASALRRSEDVVDEDVELADEDVVLVTEGVEMD
jgi:hypothetical protein